MDFEWSSQISDVVFVFVKVKQGQKVGKNLGIHSCKGSLQQKCENLNGFL